MATRLYGRPRDVGAHEGPVPTGRDNVAPMAGRSPISFPGRRDRDDPWFRIGNLDVTSSVLVPALCVVSMFVWTISPSAIGTIELITAEVGRAQLWRLVTWPLANRPDIWTALMLAMLWFFGRELERMIGRNRYLILLGTLAVVPGIVATLVGINMSGAHTVEVAVFCVFCAQLPDIRFWGAIPAWVFAVVIVGIEVLQLIGLRETDQILVLAASLVTAALVARAFGLLTDYPWIPVIATRRRRTPQRRDAPKVVAGPWQAPADARLSDAEQAELDSLLDKTSANGLDALSRSEKARLNELSKKLRQR